MMLVTRDGAPLQVDGDGALMVVYESFDDDFICLMELLQKLGVLR
jgi:hypothetical protein